MDLIQLSLMEIAYIAGAVFLAGAVRGATGFGFSMIMIVLLTFVLSPAFAAPVILLWEILASAVHLPFLYRLVNWKALFWLALGMAAATPLGVFCLLVIDAAIMRIIINCMVLFFTLLLFMGLQSRRSPGRLGMISTGFLSGIINGASANGGPPIILFFLSSPAGLPVGRASLVAFFFFSDIWASLFCWKEGLLSWDVFIVTGVFALPLFLGVYWGTRYFKRADPARFKRTVLFFLLFISGSALLHAVFMK